MKTKEITTDPSEGMLMVVSPHPRWTGWTSSCLEQTSLGSIWAASLSHPRRSGPASKTLSSILYSRLLSVVLKLPPVSMAVDLCASRVVIVQSPEHCDWYVCARWDWSTGIHSEDMGGNPKNIYAWTYLVTSSLISSSENGPDPSGMLSWMVMTRSTSNKSAKCFHKL